MLWRRKYVQAWCQVTSESKLVGTGHPANPIPILNIHQSVSCISYFRTRRNPKLVTAYTLVLRPIAQTGPARVSQLPGRCLQLQVRFEIAFIGVIVLAGW